MPGIAHDPADGQAMGRRLDIEIPFVHEPALEQCAMFSNALILPMPALSAIAAVLNTSTAATHHTRLFMFLPPCDRETLNHGLIQKAASCAQTFTVGSTAGAHTPATMACYANHS